MNFLKDETNSPIIFIDGSYFCFYRYYSVLNWWKLARKDDPIVDPSQNEEFVEKFNKLFIENIQNLPKKLNIDHPNPTIIVGKDCKRDEIWRTKLYPQYKGTRTKDDSFMGGPFFKMAYEDLFKKAGVHQILYHPHLEADDCIALASKCITNLERKIYIITSDQDYLQLNQPNIEIWSLNYKKITESKNSYNNAEKDLLFKIILGDKSDNIPSVFPKCGVKTAQKYVEDDALLKSKLSVNDQFQKQFNLNKTLIDFNNIPIELKNEFMVKNNIL